MNKKIKVAIVGVGNCASSLVQGFAYYRHSSEANPIPGIMLEDIGGHRVSDIAVVAAFDVDYRKIGNRLSTAIFAKPNCTLEFCSLAEVMNGLQGNPFVRAAPIMDGVSKHMYDYEDDESFRDYRWAYERGIITETELNKIERSIARSEIISHLKETGTEILINYLPVGSQAATEFWAEICLETGISFLNCIPNSIF